MSPFTYVIKKIRQELKDVLAKESEDLIHWLEKHIAAGQRQGCVTEVLESLNRVLEHGTKTKPAKRRTKVKR